MALTILTTAALVIDAGVPVVIVVAGIGAAMYPLPALLAIGIWALAVRSRSRVGAAPDAEAAFLGGVAAELASGAPPRAALVSAAGRADGVDLRRAARLAAAGISPRQVSEALASALPVHGRLAGAAWHLVATVGGPAVSMFELLAVRAADEGSLRRERRALTAQARASAVVVGGLPVLVLIAMAASGRLTSGADPALGFLVALGVGLQAAGLSVVWVMLRRAR